MLVMVLVMVVVVCLYSIGYGASDSFGDGCDGVFMLCRIWC